MAALLVGLLGLRPDRGNERVVAGELAAGGAAGGAQVEGPGEVAGQEDIAGTRHGDRSGELRVELACGVAQPPGRDVVTRDGCVLRHEDVVALRPDYSAPEI